MNELILMLINLFEEQKINVVIGYSEGYSQKIAPTFFTTPEDLKELIFNQNCLQNLMVYYHKHEVKQFGKPAILCTLPALKTVLQLASEKQIKENDAFFFTLTNDGKILQLNKFKEIEEYVNSIPFIPKKEFIERLQKVENSTREEKWEFWTKEFSRCIKCYACRAVCPMCYCTQCTVECNQPQWIHSFPTVLSNIEWNITRAMHLAGRCIACGECARACPMDIPIDLINAKLGIETEKQFGTKAGYKADADFVYSVYEFNDKENFIR